MDDPGLLKEGSGISGFWPPQVFREQHSGIFEEVSYFRVWGLYRGFETRFLTRCIVAMQGLPRVL